MLSVANSINILLAAAASTYVAAVPAPSPDSSLSALSVVFYNETAFKGALYTPQQLPVAQCFTLAQDWLHKAESVKISAGKSCTFFKFPACVGGGTQLIGDVATLPKGLYDNVDSMICYINKS